MDDAPLPAPQLGDRSLFPHLEARAYLAHAAISPASLAVERAVAALLADYARRGVRAFLTWDDQRQRLRENLTRLINAEPHSVALTPGTTRGISDLALSIPWRRGDRIACLRGEFPANVTPWQRASEHFGLDLVWLDAADFLREPAAALDALARTLAGGVRLLAISAVEFQTGFRMPLEHIGALCRAHGVELAVDAVQACGVIPVDVRAWQADYLTCGAHKWLMGLEGCGFLYVRPERVEALVPTVAGWLSHEAGADFLFKGAGLLRYDRPFKKSVEVFEGSTANAPGFAALGASVELLLALGIPAIADHVSAYLDRLEAALVTRGFRSLRSPSRASQSGSLSVEVPPGKSLASVQHALGASGIIASTPDGYLRFAPHWPNALDEIPLVLAAIDAA